MAVVAVCTVVSVTPLVPGTFTAKVSFVYTPDGAGLSGEMDIDLVPSRAFVMRAMVKTAVKEYLRDQGIEFDRHDTVQLL